MLPEKQTLPVVPLLAVPLWLFAVLLFWLLAQLQVLVSLSVLPVGLARLAIALYLSPLGTTAVFSLPIALSVGMHLCKVPGWLNLLTPVLISITTLVYGRIDTQGTSRYVFEAARQQDVLRTRQELLSHMARYGLVNETKALLAAGTPVNGKDAGGSTPLNWASDPAIVKLLFQYGAQPDAGTLSQGTFWANQDLLAAAFANTPDDGRSLVAEAGNEALLNLASVSTNRDDDRAAIAKMLIDRGANPNTRDESQATPLIKAAMNGHIDLMRVFLRSGADPNAYGQDGNTALALTVANVSVNSAIVQAPEKATEPVILLLASGADINQANRRGITPLMQAILGWHELRDEASRAEQKDQPRYQSLKQQRLAVIRLLVEQGADPTLKNADGDSAIALAGNDPDLQTILKGSKGSVGQPPRDL